MYFFLFLTGLLLFPEHPIHVSVSDVVVSDSRLEWTARIYKDDLLLGLYGKEVHPEALDDAGKTRGDILRYMQKHVQVTLAETPLEWEITGLHPDPEAIWITLSASMDATSIQTLHLNTTILMEVYDDQKNIVNIEVPASKKITLVFESGDKEKVVTF